MSQVYPVDKREPTAQSSRSERAPLKVGKAAVKQGGSNAYAAKIILGETEKYGGEESLMVRRERLYTSRHV